MTLYFYMLFIFVGLSESFIPGKLHLNTSGAWTSLNHRRITQAGLGCSLVEFLKTNPSFVNSKTVNNLSTFDTAALLEGKISMTHLHTFVQSSKFPYAVREIEYANVEVDVMEGEKPPAHFGAEQFREGSLRLIDLKKKVIALILKQQTSEVDFTMARKQTGKLLHTLQDFYSNSNWIETGNNDPLSILGDSIITDNYVAAVDEKTCSECTPVQSLKQFLAADDCETNLVNTGKLTSGYQGGNDVAKPVGVGKCSHGGLFDTSRYTDSEGGINKDADLRYLSPHYRLHHKAARVAIRATKLFFDKLRQEVGNAKFAKFLSMEALRTLTFTIDTTGNTFDVIKGVRKATAMFIEDGAAYPDMNFRYVLVPFNDPEFGPAYVTGDPRQAMQSVNALSANGGGDCPEMGMSGLLLALLNSLPNSDVYYFSDSAVKDAHLYQAVKAIAVKKSCRLQLFITGSCPRSSGLQGNDLYEALARSTGGVLIELGKSEIDAAFRLVRSLKGITEENSTSVLQEVSLLSVEVSSDNWVTKIYSVQSDYTIASITAVLSSAGSAYLNVDSPTAGNGIVNVIADTSTFYSVRVIKPSAGVWSFTMTAVGPYTLHVTAQSSLAFITSLEKVSGSFGSVLAPLSGNPLKGTTLFVTVEPTEDELKANRNITGYIIDTAGNHLERFTLDEGQKFYENSYFGSFQVKYDAFKLMFVAYSKDGQRIERVLPRVIKPQVFEVQISVENSSLIFTPGERASITVALRNYGKRSNFAVVVYDDKSFIESYSPHNVIVPSNDTVNIKIIFLAPLSTNDSNTTSVSVSAFIESEEAADLANFLTFEASVFSKEFQAINGTEDESKLNITNFLSLPNTTPTTFVPSVENTSSTTDSSSVENTTPYTSTPSVQNITPHTSTSSVEDATPHINTPSVQNATPRTRTPSAQDATPHTSTPSVEDAMTLTSTQLVEGAPSHTSTGSVEHATPCTSTLSVQNATPHTSTLSAQSATPHTSTPSVEDATPHTSTQSVEDALSRTSTQSVEDDTHHTSTQSVKDAPSRTSTPSVQNPVPHTSTPSVQNATPRTSTPSVEDATPRTSTPLLELTTTRANERHEEASSDILPTYGIALIVVFCVIFLVCLAVVTIYASNKKKPQHIDLNPVQIQCIQTEFENPMYKIPITNLQEQQV